LPGTGLAVPPRSSLEGERRMKELEEEMSEWKELEDEMSEWPEFEKGE
jgi:hypothetical protein